MPSDNVTLVIGITGRSSSLDAAELAVLLKVLSADYRRVTRGSLLLSRYETGSSWLYLTDALVVAGLMATQVNDIATAAQNLSKFAGAVKGIFTKKKSVKQSSTSSPMAGKSMTQLAKTAIEKGAGLEITYDANHKAGTESFSIKLTPAEVRQTYEEMVVPREVRSALPTSAAKFVRLTDAERAVDVAKGFSQLTSVPTDELEGIVSAIVYALKMVAGSSAIPLIADMMDGQGKYEVAAMFRRHLPPEEQRLLVPRD